MADCEININLVWQELDFLRDLCGVNDVPRNNICPFGATPIVESTSIMHIFALWRRAVKKAGLCLRKGCVYTKNNRKRFPFIILPKEGIVAIPCDDGSYLYAPQGAYIVQTQYIHCRSLEGYVLCSEGDYSSKEWPFVEKDIPSLVNSPWGIDIPDESLTRIAEQWTSEDAEEYIRKMEAQIPYKVSKSIKKAVAYYDKLEEDRRTLQEFALSAYKKELKQKVKPEDKRHNCLQQKQIMSVLNNFMELLAKYVPDMVIENDYYSGWTNPEPESTEEDKKKRRQLRWKYRFEADTMFGIKGYGIPDLSEQERTMIEDNPLDNIGCLLTGLTVFSLLKPMLAHAKLPVDFSVSIRNCSEQPTGWFKNELIKNFVTISFCGFMKGEVTEDPGSSSGTPVSEMPPALYQSDHHNFPIIHSKDSETIVTQKTIQESENAPPPHATLAELKKLATAKYLPIICNRSNMIPKGAEVFCVELPIHSPIKFPYTAKQAKYVKWNQFYAYRQFLSLDFNYDLYISKYAKSKYKTALSRLNVNAQSATISQQHIACILTAIDFYREYQRLESRIVTEMDQCASYLISVAGNPVANINHFSAFLREVLDTPAKKAKLVFCEDDDTIYLHYKEYWPEFINYCSKNSIEIKYSAAKFRREVLAPGGLIKPQYQTQSGRDARYDYRKVKDKIEELVLAVSKSKLALKQ